MIQRALDITLVAVLLSSCLLFSGCLKTKITTGPPASAQTVQLEWAHGFVYGLVPPVNGPLAVDDECATGLAEVYFRQTFVQIVAQGLTGSLYSPQTFTVTCASGEGMSDASSPTPPAYLRR
jgi:hypothetical protein